MTQAVVFAVPCLTYSVALEFFASAVQTNDFLARHGIRVGYDFVPGTQFVDHARNRLVTNFLHNFPGATDLFFIDDDMGWPAQKVLEFLRRPEPIIAGIGPRKTYPESWPCTPEIQDGKMVRNKDGLYSAMYCGAAFMRIKREFAEKIVQGRRTYRFDRGDGTDGRAYHVFDSGLPDHLDQWNGEDSDFCDKVRALGEKIWVDMDIEFQHRGVHVWKGNMASFMKANAEAIEKGVDKIWQEHEAAA